VFKKEKNLRLKVTKSINHFAEGLMVLSGAHEFSISVL